MKNLIPKIYDKLIFLFIIIFLLTATAFAEKKTTKIGVLAKRGPEHCLEKWSLTGEYLNNKIPGKRFVIVPLGFDRIFSAVEKGEVDFVLANPSIYVELENRFKVNRIATLKNNVNNGEYTKFGSVIFVKKINNEILRLKDLKKKAVLAVSEKSFGGFIMAWRELKEAGIDPFKDFASLGFAGTHDAVVYAVRDGKADAGIVRTDVLERMAHEGKIILENFKGVHEHGGDRVHLPFFHSTRSYPEWTIAKLQHTSDRLAEKVTTKLFEMPSDSPAALAARIGGWTIPLNYQAVHEALKFLKIGPYKNLGNIKALDVVKKYWVLISVDMVILILLAWFLINRIRLNKQFKKTQKELQNQIQERKSAQESVLHLNLILRAIRNVNRLIVEKKNTLDLIQSICHILVENKGFLNAWIVLVDKDKKFTMAGTGLGDSFAILKERVKRQGLAHCGRKVLDQPELQIVEDPLTQCVECPISDKYENRSAMRIRLEHGNKVYGLLTVSVPKALVNDREEQELFKELAADIGFGLHNLEIDRERKQALKELKKSEEFNESIIKSSSDCIIILDKEGCLEFMNPGGQRLMEIDNIEPYENKSWIDFWKDQDHKAALEVVSKAKKGNKGQFQGFCPTEKGVEKWWDIIVSPVMGKDGKVDRLLAVLRDISSQRTMEMQLRQAQKMEAIGNLAGGIAHDFNNVLSVMMGNAELAMMDIDQDGPASERIKEINKAGEKAVVLTRQLLAFSRKQIIQPQIQDINGLLSAIEKMLVRLIGEDINISIVPEPELWSVKVDSGQMEQVILNLAINASDAMPKGGKLTIETGNKDLDESYFHKKGIKEEKTGSYVMLAVTDNGVGMEKKVQDHIFEPFFTTKEIGKGTGLGLSTVYGIVKQNNGFVWVYSEPGQGTSFKVYFPKEMGDAVPKEDKPLPAKVHGGSETLLIVEDDSSLRKFARKSLEIYGYTILGAENGEAALKICEEQNGLISLMITDVVMPKMGGKEVVERLNVIYPHIKVIYMSGYTDNAIVHHGVLASGLNFLQKPFTPEVLARKVREVLNT